MRLPFLLQKIRTAPALSPSSPERLVAANEGGGHWEADCENPAPNEAPIQPPAGGAEGGFIQGIFEEARQVAGFSTYETAKRTELPIVCTAQRDARAHPKSRMRHRACARTAIAGNGLWLAAAGGGAACVLGMSSSLGSKVPCAARRRRSASKTQGQNREGLSEGSVERNRGPANRSRITARAGITPSRRHASHV